MAKTVRINAQADPVAINTNGRVLDVLLASQCDVLMACGGKGLCATCHVFVEEGAENLSPKTPRERTALTMLRDACGTSRLACQARVLRDGVRISLPRGMFLEGSDQLESLIGRRAEAPVLHPVDGRVLIEEGKIITRSRIQQLQSVDIDMKELRSRAMTA